MDVTFLEGGRGLHCYRRTEKMAPNARKGHAGKLIRFLLPVSSTMTPPMVPAAVPRTFYRQSRLVLGTSSNPQAIIRSVNPDIVYKSFCCVDVHHHRDSAAVARKCLSHTSANAIHKTPSSILSLMVKVVFSSLSAREMWS